MRYSTANPELPPPTDPSFVPPMPTPEQFLANDPEDADLLATGKWDDQPAATDDGLEPDEPPSADPA